MHIGLLTTDTPLLADHDTDTAPLLAGLTAAGLRASAPVWHDPAVDWAAFDLLVIRSPWDYPERYAEFTGWLDRAAGRTRILNAPDLIRWNIDKRYLADLHAQGIPVVPYTFCGTTAEAEAAIGRLAPGRVIVKPTVSAGSRDTGLFQPDDPRARELAGRILAAGKTPMVQPAVEEVITHGENALFFLNGEYAYACHKGPILLPGGGYIGGEYTEEITRAEPAAAEIELGRRAIAALARIAARRGFAADAGQPLYARVDIASRQGAVPQIIEVELFEPAYFSAVVPEAVGHFVEAVRRRLRS
ncbi:RimK family alpha-L-glutamate ligase [Actinoplanes sp. NPDC049599]|uniref:RimK family alpha-L-glutamate ligase n=1 Tax=Actinoplanes sp. NPDC049599 TaxID=3363903 RepID=UPI003794E9D5